MPEESVNFDTTENLIIEGENLEVLKLLQKSYYSRVKMIYIDPPYNTGNEFIYPDDFRDSLNNYLRYTKQVSEQGVAQTTNRETSGRYHSNWLNMMYPRLYLARNLLREDGAIFVSIDDHEVHNLRLAMDEIFGPENFVATVIWQKVFSPKNTARHFSEDHDYIVVYARHAETWRPRLLPRTEEANARYENPDNDSRGPWTSSDMTARNYYSEGQYEVTSPSGKKFTPPRGRYWGMNREKFLELDRDRRVWWGSKGDSMPRLKRFLSEVKQGIVPQTLWTHDEVGHTQEAKKELIEFVKFENTDNVLDTVKPTRLIQRMLQIATDPQANDIVLDFFAGSGPTAHAVLKQNREDGGNRRFVLVQLPEPLPAAEKSLKTIADIAKTRLRNAVAAMKADGQQNLPLGALSDSVDLGFKLTKLDSSNFDLWSGEKAATGEQIAEQLRLYADHRKPDRSAQDLLYEIILKSGFPLSATVAVNKLDGLTVYDVNNGALLVCLDDPVNPNGLRAVMVRKPKQFICLDAAFRGNDQLKTNTVLEMKSHSIGFHTV